MASLAALISSVRNTVNDDGVSNVIYNETVSGTADGTNTHFRLQHQQIVPGSIYLSYGTNWRIQTGFTPDYTNGYLTFASAPANASKIGADYSWLWYDDEDYTDFLIQAANAVSATDPTTVDPGLTEALVNYAAAKFYARRAASYANKYSSTGGQASQNVAEVTKAFMLLADSSTKKADKERDDFYKRNGLREAPFSTVFNWPFDPYTPKR